MKRKAFTALLESDIFQYGSSDETVWPSSPTSKVCPSDLPYHAPRRDATENSDQNIKIEETKAPQGIYNHGIV